MKACKALSLIQLVLLWSGAAFTQDPVKVDPQHYKVVLENTSVRVLRISYAPGAKSVMHQHPESIAIPRSDSKVRFYMAGGKSAEDSMASEPAFDSPGGPDRPG